MGAFSKIKDRVLEQTGLKILNQQLQPYGRVTELRLDSSARTIHLEVELRGETAPLQIDASDYEISRDGDRYFVSAKDIRTSREWLTALAKDRLCNRRFELPETVGRALMLAL